MSALSSIAAKAALIATGGVAVTVISIVIIVVLYCCTCHRQIRGVSSKAHKRPEEPQGQSQGTLSTASTAHSRSSPAKSSSETLPTYNSTLTMSTLATLERGLHQELEVDIQARMPHSRERRKHSELEISRKTWSAYETLPRDLTCFGGHKYVYDSEVDHSDTDNADSLQNVSDDVDTLDNDAYSTSTELGRLERHTDSTASQNRIRFSPSPFVRISTVSTCSSGSGYVINSLHGPHSPSKDWTSSYSTGSEGYVINQLEWTRPTAQPRSALQCIAEDSTTSQVDYLQIIH